MARVITVANQKGGVGKTTTVINLGAALAEYERDTLLVDLDPQAALSAGFGINSYALEKSIYNVMVDAYDVTLDSIIQPVRPHLDVVPSNIDLAAAEMELIPTIGREYILKEHLATIQDRYHYILIDTPPSLGLLTINALTAAGEVLIPVQCEFLAMRGMRVLLQTIDKIRAKLNPGLEILGILGTMYNSRTIHAQEVLEELQSVFGQKVFDIVIKSSIKFAEAPVAQQPILEYARRHKGAMAYRALAEVIIDGE